jgi:predicted NAD-dependent protein-ADP-ribosyltransferase YbiA (DUF1768 family)
MNSRISKYVYPINKKIHPGDNGSNISLYEIELFDDVDDVVISIGSLKNIPETSFTYAPIYLIKYNNKAICIGYFEFEINDENKLFLNKENKILRLYQQEFLENNEPLLFPFVTKEYVRKATDIEKQKDHIFGIDADENQNQDGIFGKDIPENQNQDGIFDKDIPENQNQDGIFGTDTPERQKNNVQIFSSESERANEENNKQKQTHYIDLIEEDNEEEEEIIDANKYLSVPSYREDTFKIMSEFKKKPLLPTENEKTDKQIYADFMIFKGNDKNKDAVKNLYWIKKFMSNLNYEQVKSEKNDEIKEDCFFYIIVEAFKEIGEETTVLKLREKLATNYPKKLFDIRRDEKIKMQEKEEDIKNSVNNLRAQDISLRSQLQSEEDITKKKMLVKKINGNVLEVKKKLEERNLLRNEINNVPSTLELLQNQIREKMFCPTLDEIACLEYALKFKCIFFSENIYVQNDLNNCVVCGKNLKYIQQVPSIENFEFRPDYYILIDYDSKKNNFSLVSYKRKKILSFSEIPFGLKLIISSSCLQYPNVDDENGSSFLSIPDFKDFNEKQGKKEQNKPKKSEEEKDCPYLYNKNTVFQFYFQSSDAVPGKGSGEKIPPERIAEFSELNKIKNWRQQLSNFYIREDGNSLFSLDGKDWASVEHYFQGAKFIKNHPDFYAKFAMNSASEWCKDPILAKKMGGDKGIITVNGKTIKRKHYGNITADPDFNYDNVRWQRLYDSQKAKYEQNVDLKKMLLLTKDAKLVHVVRKSREIFCETMTIRKELLEKELLSLEEN